LELPSKIKDPALAKQGKLKIEWAESRMPVLMQLRREYSESKPLQGVKVGGCLHVTTETAVLVRTLRAAGAETAWSGCNPLSTQDDVAAALEDEKIDIFAWRGLSKDEYYWCIEKVIEMNPNFTLDDGADLVFKLHEDHPNQAEEVVGGTEETTTGVHRLRALAKEKKLKYPIIGVNDAETKWDFDNVYGTGQSSIDGILRSTNVLVAGKNFVIGGYGHCGRGIAMRAKGHGANVIVTEVNAVNALKAAMEGLRVMPMIEAAKIGDIFITATGCDDVITAKHMNVMKDGVILCNTGHFNAEVSVSELERIAKGKREIRPNNTEYKLEDGRRLYLLAEGRLVNLGAAEGHPSEVMDMSFANQFLSLIYLAKEGKKMNPGVYEVPEEQDQLIAKIKLQTMGMKTDQLTPEQVRYVQGYGAGT
jgi:adenosylhomocysteinase